jgi:hypothetical protein
MTERQKKHILLDVITDGLVYSPIIQWDEYGEPYIGNEERADKVFSSLNELATVLRQLADELER